MFDQLSKRLPKPLLFAILGAIGCLVGWAAGEGLLALAGNRRETSEAKSPSLLSPLKGPPVVTPPPTAEPGRRAPPPPPPPELARGLEREHAHAGSVEISLIWHDYNDLDLHCIDPDGAEVFFGKKTAPSGGWLDVDMNVGGRGGTHSADNPAVEHIRWPLEHAPTGRYRVYVHHFARHEGKNPTRFEVDVLANGERKEFSGSISAGDPRKLVYEFEVGPRLRIAFPAQLAVNPGGSNRFTVCAVRDDCTGPVTVKFLGDLDGLKFGPQSQVHQGVILPAEKSAIEIGVEADETARPGVRKIDVVAELGQAAARAVLPVTVQAIPPGLRLSVPEVLSLRRGQNERMTVRILRDRCKEPVAVSFSGDLEGISLPETVIPGDKSEATLAVETDWSAREGPRPIMASASGQAAKSYIQFHVSVDPPYSWRELLMTAAWTGILALGLSLALAMGQNRYLRRPWLSTRQFAILVAGSLAAGAVAGGIGQVLFGLLAPARFIPNLGFLTGWMFLGGLVGLGTTFFVPNMRISSGLTGGLAGGLIGALGFLLCLAVLSTMGPETFGRFTGALVLGASVGLILAAAERAFRSAWLEVRFGPIESRQVNLGAQPVTIGSDRSRCTVFVRDVAPVVASYWLEGERIYREQPATAMRQEVCADDTFVIGNTSVTLRTSRKAASSAGRTAIAPPPPPPTSRKGPAATAGPSPKSPAPVGGFPHVTPPPIPPAPGSSSNRPGVFPPPHPHIPPPPPPGTGRQS